jgi:DNA-binding NarL/FixJ family response regulator
LRLCYKNSPDYEEYVFESQTWQRQKEVLLSDRQKEILKLAKQGRNQKEMANVMNVSIKTVENIKTVLFEKLRVKSMEQAVIFATNHRLIFESE